MNQKSTFVSRHLSTTAFLLIYALLVVTHIVSDSFQAADQLGLIIVMMPFVLLGLALDFILSRNNTLDNWLRVVAQLLPLGIFALQIISSVLLMLGKDTYGIFNYLFWIFIAAPLFIASYQKEGFRQRMTQAGIGTAAIIAIYLFLSGQTDNLDSGYGSIAYYTAYFLLLYSSSAMKKLSKLGMVLGFSNAIFLLMLRYLPFTQQAKDYGWDYNFTSMIEMLIIITIIACLLICVVEAFKSKKPIEGLIE